MSASIATVEETVERNPNASESTGQRSRSLTPEMLLHFQTALFLGHVGQPEKLLITKDEGTFKTEDRQDGEEKRKLREGEVPSPVLPWSGFTSSMMVQISN